MARQRVGVTDISENLVRWDAGETISAIAQRLGYSRPTVLCWLLRRSVFGIIARSRAIGHSLTGR